jgi:sphingoid base N-palmitoyltransferase
MMNLTFYWSLLVTQFFHTKRKDFWEMFLHHIVTVPLIAFSWVCNIHRIGSLIMISLDAAEFFLESAKSFKYTKQKKFSNIGFIIFTIVWIITRLIVFPKLFYITTFETHLPAYPAYYFLNSLLLILLILNIYWTYFILKIIHKVFINQSIQSEIGSSSEESGEEYLKK